MISADRGRLASRCRCLSVQSHEPYYRRRVCKRKVGRDRSTRSRSGDGRSLLDRGKACAPFSPPWPYFNSTTHVFRPIRTQELVERHAGVIDDAAVVVADGNLPPEGFARVAKLCARRNVPLVFEPTSVAKCSTPFSARVSANFQVARCRDVAVVSFLPCRLRCSRVRHMCKGGDLFLLWSMVCPVYILRIYSCVPSFPCYRWLELFRAFLGTTVSGQFPLDASDASNPSWINSAPPYGPR